MRAHRVRRRLRRTLRAPRALAASSALTVLTALTVLMVLAVCSTLTGPLAARADETPPPAQGGADVIPTAAPEPTGQPEPTDAAPAEPEPTAEPTSTAEPTPTPEPEPTPTPGSTPTAEPTPTPEPEPSHDAAISSCEEGRTALIASAPPVISQIGMERAWSITRGEDVTVAVVDSGIAGDNPHFEGALTTGVDLTGKARADGAADASGQGTAVAGAIGARTVPGSGLVGLADGVELMPVRVFASTANETTGAGAGPTAGAGSRAGTAPTAERTAAGIGWAADHGAQVIVVPQALTEDSPALRTATEQAIDSGALIVASAGDRQQSQTRTQEADDESTERFPAAYDGVLGVTALDSQGSASGAAVRNDDIDLAVPAQSAPTAFLDDGDCVVAQESPSSALATGYAGAVAALVAADHPDEAPADWAYRLMVTALRTTPAEWSPTVGWGTIAPYSALTFINDGTALGPQNPRGTRAAETVAPAFAAQPQPDPGPQRRQRLAGTVGLGGATLLTLALVASQAPRRANAHTTKKGEPHAR